MARLVGCFFAFIALTSLAQAQDIAAASNSPYDIAKFVETHHDFDWEPLWRALHVNPNEMFLPVCEQDFEGVAPCSAELITVVDPLQMIVILEQQTSGFQVMLRYRTAGEGAWRFAGAYSPLVKYFHLEHHVTRFGSKPFFVTTSQGISGSGVSSKIELWFDLTRDPFEPALEFTAEGSYFPFPDGISRKTGGLVVSLTTQPVERIAVGYHVQFGAYGKSGKELPIVSRMDRVVYTRSSSGEFQMDPHLSTATEHEIEAFYDIEKTGYSDEEFLKFNFEELSALAAKKNDERLPWLSEFLKQAPDIPETRQLKALMARSR